MLVNSKTDQTALIKYKNIYLIVTQISSLSYPYFYFKNNSLAADGIKNSSRPINRLQPWRPI